MQAEKLEVGKHRTQLLSALSGVQNLWHEAIPGQAASKDADSELETVYVCVTESERKRGKGLFLDLTSFQSTDTAFKQGEEKHPSIKGCLLLLSLPPQSPSTAFPRG